jgi:hypothetical protein
MLRFQNILSDDHFATLFDTTDTVKLLFRIWSNIGISPSPPSWNMMRNKQRTRFVHQFNKSHFFGCYTAVSDVHIDQVSACKQHTCLIIVKRNM